MLEQLYDADFLRKNPFYAFVLGAAYSAIGIGASVLLFPQDPALVAVLIISVLFLPSLYKLSMIEEAEESLSIIEEAEESREGGILRTIYRQKQFIKVYFYAFFGMFVVFTFFSTIMPTLAANVLFRQQLELIGVAGKAVAFSQPLFTGLLANNVKVLFLCFVVSLVLGNGAIFLITWNASVWGTIFGNIAKTGAIAVGKNPFIYLLLILISVLPHVILEIGAYIFATISGTELSEGFLKERFGSPAFRNLIAINALILLLSILVLVAGAAVETYVLNNFETYRTIISQAFR